MKKEPRMDGMRRIRNEFDLLCQMDVASCCEEATKRDRAHGEQ